MQLAFTLAARGLSSAFKEKRLRIIVIFSGLGVRREHTDGLVGIKPFTIVICI